MAIYIREIDDTLIKEGIRIMGIWSEYNNSDIECLSATTIPNPMVGIFWLIMIGSSCNIVYDAVPISHGEKYGDALGHGEHYAFWEKLAPKSSAEVLLRDNAYDAYPRGRIVFMPKKNKFILYIDKCIRTDDLCMVMDNFQIDGVDIEIKHDEHYRCAQCNPHFINI